MDPLEVTFKASASERLGIGGWSFFYDHHIHFHLSDAAQNIIYFIYFKSCKMTLCETRSKFLLHFQEVKGVIQHKWEECIREERSSKARDIKRSLKDVLNYEAVVSYIKKCIRLAWRLVTHVPAMRIGYQSAHLQRLPENKGPYQGRGTCTSTEVSPEDGSSEIEYLWPALIDGEEREVCPARISGH